MPVISTALGLGLGAAAGGIFGGLGASSAGNAEAKASEQAAALQAQEEQQALQFQEQQWGTEQREAAPWLAGGTQAENELSSLTKTPGQGLLAPWTGTFTAPTAAQAAATPGYQFQLQQGQEALQNSAAARGGLLSGNTAEALDNYSQGVASQNYQQVFNDALTQYQQGYNQFENNQANEYNRLAGLSGVGQQAVTTLGQLGQQASSNTSNILLGSGAQIGADYQNAGAARASGYAGLGNAAGGIANALGELPFLSNLFGGGGGGYGSVGGTYPGIGTTYGTYS